MILPSTLKISPSMQQEEIILIPPTHEQTVLTFHVEGPMAEDFLEFLKEHEVTPWRPPEPQQKTAPDGKGVMQIEIDTSESEAMLRTLTGEFLALRQQ